MKKTLIIFLALFCFLFNENSFAAPVGNPRIYVENSTYDFGSITEGSIIEHDFIIKNTGNATLRIKQIITSCGCTAANVAKKSLEPGESTTLKAVFKTRGFSGSKYRTVHVYTNDLGNSEKVLTIKGDIVSDVSIRPAILNYGVQWYKNIREKKAYKDVVVQIKDPNAKILDVYNKDKYLDLQMVEKTNEHALFRVYLKDTIPTGEFREKVVVTLANSSRKSVNIPIVARIQGDVFVTPSTVSFGALDGGVKERIVKLTNLADTPLVVEKIKTSDSVIDAQVIEIEKGKSFNIVLKVDSNEVSDDLKATVKVYTNNPNYEELSFGVYGIAAEN